MIRPGTATDWSAVLSLIRAWPSHFIPAAEAFVELDYRHLPSLVWEEHGQVTGFVIWSAHAIEIEMLWMAVDPNHSRRGIGRALVGAVVSRVSTQRIVSLKTSAPGATVPGTQFDSDAFGGTMAFFQHLGFRVSARLPAYWGSSSDAIVLQRHIDSNGAR